MKRSLELKEQGGRHFQKKRVAHALKCYDMALQLLPEDHQERAVLHSSKGACLLYEHKWEEVRDECTLALEIDPGYTRIVVQLSSRRRGQEGRERERKEARRKRGMKGRWCAGFPTPETHGQ